MAGMKRTTLRDAQGHFVKEPVRPTLEWSYSDSVSTVLVYRAHRPSLASRLWSLLTRTAPSERLTLEPVSAQ
jgi:hypothetical protein